MFNIYDSPCYKVRKDYSDAMLESVIEAKLAHIQSCESGRVVIDHFITLRAVKLLKIERLIGINPK